MALQIGDGLPLDLKGADAAKMLDALDMVPKRSGRGIAQAP